MSKSHDRLDADHSLDGDMLDELVTSSKLWLAVKEHGVKENTEEK